MTSYSRFTRPNPVHFLKITQQMAVCMREAPVNLPHCTAQGNIYCPDNDYSVSAENVGNRP